MDFSIPTLYDAAEHLCRNLLRADAEYSSLFRENEAAWSAFCETCTHEVSGKVLDIINGYQHLGYLREQYFLLLGLRMGLELGGTDGLFSA